MKILVTGSNGQLGSDLAPRLEAAGFSVAAFSSKALDITAREKVLGAIEEARPRLIINSAAYTKVDLAETEKDRAYGANRDGAANMADAAAKVKAALIHISTDFVFDGSRPLPYKETDTVNPLSVYGESKLRGEEEIRKRLKKHIIVRTSWLYGAQGNNFVKTILRLASERDKLRVVYDQAGSPTWTGDLADALVKIAASIATGAENYGVYHYSNEGVASWYDFAEEIVEEGRRLGFPVKCRAVEPILSEEYPTPARRPPYSVFDKNKIKATFGITIPHWRVSLGKMLMEMNELRGEEADA